MDENTKYCIDTYFSAKEEEAINPYNLSYEEKDDLIRLEHIDNRFYRIAYISCIYDSKKDFVEHYKGCEANPTNAEYEKLADELIDAADKDVSNGEVIYAYLFNGKVVEYNVGNSLTDKERDILKSYNLTCEEKIELLDWVLRDGKYAIGKITNILNTKKELIEKYRNTILKAGDDKWCEFWANHLFMTYHNFYLLDGVENFRDAIKKENFVVLSNGKIVAYQEDVFLQIGEISILDAYGFSNLDKVFIIGLSKTDEKYISKNIIDIYANAKAFCNGVDPEGVFKEKRTYEEWAQELVSAALNTDECDVEYVSLPSGKYICYNLDPEYRNHFPW